MINELPTENVEKNEDGPANRFPEDKMSKLRNLIDEIDIAFVDKYT